MSYAKNSDDSKFPALIADIGAVKVTRVVFGGDIKGGGLK